MTYVRDHRHGGASGDIKYTERIDGPIKLPDETYTYNAVYNEQRSSARRGETFHVLS
jgi:hypothetical protein